MIRPPKPRKVGSPDWCSTVSVQTSIIFTGLGFSRPGSETFVRSSVVQPASSTAQAASSGTLFRLRIGFSTDTAMPRVVNGDRSIIAEQ